MPEYNPNQRSGAAQLARGPDAVNPVTLRKMPHTAGGGGGDPMRNTDGTLRSHRVCFAHHGGTDPEIANATNATLLRREQPGAHAAAGGTGGVVVNRKSRCVANTNTTRTERAQTQAHNHSSEEATVPQQQQQYRARATPHPHAISQQFARSNVKLPDDRPQREINPTNTSIPESYFGTGGNPATSGPQAEGTFAKYHRVKFAANGGVDQGFVAGRGGGSSRAKGAQTQQVPARPRAGSNESNLSQLSRASDTNSVVVKMPMSGLWRPALGHLWQWGEKRVTAENFGSRSWLSNSRVKNSEKTSAKSSTPMGACGQFFKNDFSERFLIRVAP